jgi:DNA (cytosine-5)-methyltransferase 1
MLVNVTKVTAFVSISSIFYCEAISSSKMVLAKPRGYQNNVSGKKKHTLQASVIDLFCGAGGLSYGFKLEGFKITAGIDIDETCRYPFEFNNEAPFARYDISKLKADDLDSMFLPNMPRVLIGCAPCQPFSTYNKKKDHPQWFLLHAFADLIVATKPDIISMENVPRLQKFQEGKVFEEFLKKLKNAGYIVDSKVVYAPDYGVPQTRSRLIVLASLHGRISLVSPTHEPDGYLKVEDVISYLPPLRAGEVSQDDPLHWASTLSKKNMERIKQAQPGGTWRDWEESLVDDCHKDPRGRHFSSVYGRMAWDDLAPTITTQFSGFGNGRFGHPEQNRALSLREGALLQNFPPEYAFVAPGETPYIKLIARMIGNAVPVNLARAIARSIAIHLHDLD